MGTLIDGKWQVDHVNSSVKDGEFKRQNSVFRNKIENKEGAKHPAVKDRYHLYVSYACPWAHRTLIVRALKGLEDIIPVSIVSPRMMENGWSFIDEYPDMIEDSVNSANFIRDLYIKADPKVNGKATVPVLWDKVEETIVSNESAEIIRFLNTEFDHITGNDLDLYPEDLRAEIDELNEYIYPNINNGVYRSGFATTQEAYDKAVRELFSALDKIDARLETKDFLVGDRLTEADIRLFTTLVRFDLVYYSHFKCNLKMLKEYTNLQRYTKALYNHELIKPTVNLGHIKTHYYYSQRSINPTGVVPLGPELDF